MNNQLNKRVPNFSSSETELLTTLVKKYSHILENKKTDAVNNMLKEETWSKLAEDFNSSSGLYERSSKALRAKYENLKKSLKRKFGEHRRSLYGTGGGPPRDLNLTQEEETIMELAGPSVEGLPARFDSDTIPEQNEKPSLIIPQSQVIAEVVVHSSDICDDGHEEVKVDNKSKFDKVNATKSEMYINNTPSRFPLKHKRSTPLRHNPEAYANTMESYKNLSKKKKELIDVQIRSLEEKMKQDAKEHDLKCELLSLEIMLKKRELNQ